MGAIKKRLSFARNMLVSRKQGSSETFNAVVRELWRWGHPDPEIERRRKQLLGDKRWFTSTGKRVADIAKVGIEPLWGDFLKRVCLAIQAREALELGSCLGISGAYIASATERLTTIEGDPGNCEIAQETLREHNAECVTGRFQEVLPDILGRTKLDFVFLDGHHLGQATLDYYDQIMPHLSNRAVFVFDDISWSDEMKQAWDTICQRSRNWIYLRKMGIVTT